MLPEWLSEKLVRDLGAERAEAFEEARPLPPPLGLRVRVGERDEVIAEIRNARPEAEVSAGDAAPQAILVRRAGDSQSLDAYVEGRVAMQEQGAQIVGLLTGAAEGERVVDACAGRGGKTGQLAEAVGASGSVAALDLHESKLERIAGELTRLGLTKEVETHVVDLSVGTAGLDGRFDRVLVDAPCTGIGTLHRRPEILLRTEPGDPARMGELQVTILANACRLAASGGTIVYAVCSPTREEGASVLSRVLHDHADLVAPIPVDTPWPFDGVSPDADGIVRIGPWDGDCDAYQVARLRRV
jgi:16S rRNA (cytosine967-C5)-methyltransferase